MKLVMSAIIAVGLLGVLPGAASAEEDELCIGPACLRHHEHHDEVVRDGPECREVTIHEHRDGEDVSKHIRRCD